MRVTHLNIVTEHIVISNFQAGNAGQLTFTLLYFEQIILAGKSYLPQFVQFRIHPVCYHTAFIHQQRRIILNLFRYFFTDRQT